MLAALLIAGAGVAVAAAVMDLDDESPDTTDAEGPEAEGPEERAAPPVAEPDQPDLTDDVPDAPEPPAGDTGDTPDTGDTGDTGDTIFRTAGDDEIEILSGQTGFGLDGNDTLGKRYEENITLDGGAGDDLLLFGNNGTGAGGDGNDTINAYSYTSVTGGQGDDQIRAGRDAVVEGGDGNDTINAGIFSTVSGGSGDDLIDGSRGSQLAGGSGNDTIAGWGSTVDGGDGNDVLRVSESRSYAGAARGGAGADVLTGRGEVNLHGGQGDDTLNYSRSFSYDNGIGTLTGGDGADVFNIEMGHPGYTLVEFERTVANIRDFDPEEDILALDASGVLEFDTRNAGRDTEVLVRFTGGHEGTDAKVKTAVIVVEGVSDLSADQIRLIDGDGPELDPLFGNDTDEAFSSSGSSLYSTFGGGDTVVAGGVHDVARLGDGNDILTATSRSLAVNAGTGDDSITWTPDGPTDRSSFIELGEGDDTLTAGGDHLRVSTYSGANVVDISRDAGPDVEIFSDGVDQLTVGMGHDVYMYDSGGQMTVNIYPEHLDRDAGVLRPDGASVTDFTVTLNLPPEIDGPLEITREYDDRYEQLEVFRYTFSTQDGTALWIMEIPEDNAFSSDDVTINRDVVFT